MLFTSLLFVAFFAVVFGIHALLPHRARNLLLLLASYLFYATWNPRFLALIWLSTAVDYVAGRIIGASDRASTRRSALLVSVVVNLSILAFFKYYNFFIDSLDLMLVPFGATAASLHLDLVLPLGISFYTFQTMSYTIDVYRGRMRPVRDLPDFALFVCFFPQLVAGPIERAPHLMPQIQSPRRITARHLHEGLALAGWGVFKKVVIADNLSRIVDPVYALDADPTGLQVVVATYAFLFQVYTDFSSYSDIARGTARMLGFDLMLNFDTPYFARDMGEFWRRWHISLSTWLRDYLYIPLGGNRGGEIRIAFNLFMTLLLAGLWHGSNGTFLVFGAYHGILVVIARLYRQRWPVRGGPIWPGALLSMHLFAVGLVFFRGQTVAQCLSLFGAVFTDFQWDPAGLQPMVVVLLAMLPILVFDLSHRRFGSDTFVLSWPAPLRAAAYFAVFYAIVLLGRSDGLEFVYFQF